MTLKIIQEKENKLFGRKEIKATMESGATPNRSHVLEILSKKFGIPKENIKLRGVRGNFGTRNFTIEANIYDSQENKDAVELRKKKETPATIKE